MSRNIISNNTLCKDCLDTGWLENREEGRYPCTCITEMEPYQLLQAKCVELSYELKDANDAANAFDHKIIERDNKISKLEIALRIKGEEHECCTKDLIGLEAKCAELKVALQAFVEHGYSYEAATEAIKIMERT